LAHATLREGRATVATIAQEVGYDSKPLSRAFKRLAGMPPTAWQRPQRSA
jgi:AraC-like DNA-binding protein